MTQYGYGLKTITDPAAIPLEKIKQFIKEYLPETYALMLKECADDDEGNLTSESDQRDWLSCIDGNDRDYSIMNYVVQVMTEHTGIPFIACQEEDRLIVMMPDTKPWDMTDRQKSASKDEIDGILASWLTKAGIDTKLTGIGDTEFTYFG